MRLTFKYDGTPESAKVICAETGETIENIRSFELSGNGKDSDLLTVTAIIRTPKAAPVPLMPDVSGIES